MPEKGTRKSIPSLPVKSHEGAVNFVIKFAGGRAMYMVDVFWMSHWLKQKENRNTCICEESWWNGNMRFSLRAGRFTMERDSFSEIKGPFWLVVRSCMIDVFLLFRGVFERSYGQNEDCRSRPILSFHWLKMTSFLLSLVFRSTKRNEVPVLYRSVPVMHIWCISLVQKFSQRKNEFSVCETKDFSKRSNCGPKQKFELRI